MLVKGIARLIGRTIADRVRAKHEAGEQQLEVEWNQLSDEQRQRIESTFAPTQKTLGKAYLCCLFMGTHNLYLNRPVRQFIFWVTAGGFFAWWAIDMVILYYMVAECNRTRKRKLIQRMLTLQRQRPQQQPVLKPKLA